MLYPQAQNILPSLFDWRIPLTLQGRPQMNSAKSTPLRCASPAHVARGSGVLAPGRTGRLLCITPLPGGISWAWVVRLALNWQV